MAMPTSIEASARCKFGTCRAGLQFIGFALMVESEKRPFSVLEGLGVTIGR